MIVETLTAIKAAFLADSAIGGPLGDRIHNYEAPQETAFPYLVFSISSTAEDHVLRAATNSGNAWRFTIDVQIVDAEKKTHAQISAIADAVLSRLLVEDLPFSPADRYSFNVRLLNFSQGVTDERPTATLQFSMSVAFN